MRKNKDNFYDISKIDKKAMKNRKRRLDSGNKRGSKRYGVILKIFGKIIVCLILLFIIVMSITITALTVYVMKGIDVESTISLEKQSIIGNEFIKVYGKDEKGNRAQLSLINSGTRRIWVDITDVPKHVKDAVVSTEDHKFYEHDGVDFWRTFGAFTNMFLHFWRTNQGGSTITQQLLKNITGQKDVHGMKGISRKINEIYKAMSLEKKYSKDQILQAYLNIIYVGHGDNVGIATAAKLYFNKDLKNVTIAEAACLAALIQNPGKYDMLKDPTKIVPRRNYVLKKMYDLGKITYDEYEKAKASKVVAKKGSLFKDKQEEKYQSYFVDTALNEVVGEYMKANKIKDWDIANTEIKKKGLQVFTTIDVNMQAKLEKEYENLKFPRNIQSAFVIFDLNGNMKACVGGLGKKTAGDRANFNYATSNKAMINPGSTMKAFVYADAIEKNKITYSSMFKDAPFKMVEGKMWPENIHDKHSDSMVTIKNAVQKSLNTVPTKILHDYGNKGIIEFCNFLTNKLKISHIVSPKNPTKDGRFETSAMAMGSLTNGVVLSEFSNAFQIFANGGKFRQGTTLEKILNQSGEEFIKLKNKTTRVISNDTSAVVNRLLRNVVLEGGTGVAANLDCISTEVFGKTGTSNDGKNLLFIGGTPEYVAGIWFGSTNGKEIPKGTVNPSKIWGNIMKTLLGKREPSKFSVVAAKEQTYCCDSGLLAKNSCPRKEIGYYKRDNFLTKSCNVHR